MNQYLLSVRKSPIEPTTTVNVEIKNCMLQMKPSLTMDVFLRTYFTGLTYRFVSVTDGIVYVNQ